MTGGVASDELRAVEVGAVTRHQFVLRSALSGAATLGLSSVGPLVADALAKEGEADAAILNFALTFEYLSIAFYRAALRGGGLDSQSRSLASTILDHEEKHADALTHAIRGLGAKPAPVPRARFGTLADGAATLKLAQTLEELGVSAYNGAAPQIRSGEVLAAAGSIVQVEARHAAAVRALRGEDIAPAAFDKPQDAKHVQAELGRLKLT